VLSRSVKCSADEVTMRLRGLHTVLGVLMLKFAEGLYFFLDTRKDRSLNSTHARKEVVQWTVANPARWLTPRSQAERIHPESLQLDASSRSQDRSRERKEAR